MVTAQTLKLAPLVVVQPVQVPKEKPELGVAVSATEAPTGTTAMHVTDGQLIPYDKLVTVPPRVGVTCTLSVGSVLLPDLGECDRSPHRDHGDACNRRAVNTV